MPEALPTLGPQAAIEEAAARLLREALLLGAHQCARMFDGRPPPAAGDVFLAVWSRGGRESAGQPAARTALDERLGVSVTVTLRSLLPGDRRVQERDRLAKYLDDARALLHGDSLDHRVIRLANELAGRSQAATRHVGFCEGLMFARFEPWVLADGAWFGAAQSNVKEAGVHQTAHFERARLVQAIGGAV